MTAKPQYTCASGVDPLVIEAMRLCRINGLSPRKLAAAAGLDRNAVWHWRKADCGPQLMSFQAFLNAAGYRLVIEPIDPMEDNSADRT